jgi:Mg-chelatase subunit ChlD
VDNRDRLQVVIFNSQSVPLTPLSPLADKREDVKRRVSGLVEGGDTSLYDATLQAYNELKTTGDPNYIRAVVVLSDGADTSSTSTLSDLMAQIGNVGEEGVEYRKVRHSVTALTILNLILNQP